ncbi:PREDICTED: uncharacterized protein LOC108616975 isoform X1 [Drosophila arizonae]|uniref:Uncharacterized protein LOC108616975 isoform X1 n=1 Tax=Drosophila arizonae TaxID=7263 RepID=A0ABM1PLG3_DROAR|nr:PREDICTED: uncharacterized protein LOC108616975 isoform X1 [Drosophila arizonae]
MAATDGQIILAASRFGDATPVYLRDFSKQPLPAVAKILKGQHQALGVPTLSAPSLQSTALFLSAGKKYQILAQPIKIKEGRKPTNVGAKVLIPETYNGYFELLSEDGRSTRCIDSVLELARRRNARVLVRETFRCQQLNRTIHAGELLTTMNDNGKFLQCRNIKDEIINLPLDTKAKFSPIAREDSISGVHTVKNLLLKRMPVIVRLVHGSAPKGLKQPFVPELRLLGCVEIDRIFALPLQKDTDLVPVPLNAKIKLQRAKNMEQLEHFIEYTRFLDKAQRLLADARDRLQVVDLKLSEKEKKDSKFSSRNGSGNRLPIVMLPSAAGLASGWMESGYVLRKSASCDSWSKQHQLQHQQQQQQQQQALNSNDIAEEYNEIDHIYDYVRGLTPLSKGLARFEPICESPTLKSHHTDSSGNGNYCSLIRAPIAATAAAPPAQQQQQHSNSNSSICWSITIIIAIGRRILSPCRRPSRRFRARSQPRSDSVPHYQSFTSRMRMRIAPAAAAMATPLAAPVTVTAIVTVTVTVTVSNICRQRPITTVTTTSTTTTTTIQLPLWLLQRSMHIMLTRMGIHTHTRTHTPIHCHIHTHTTARC